MFFHRFIHDCFGILNVERLTELFSQLTQATTIEITLKAYIFDSILSEMLSVTFYPNVFMVKFVRTLLIHCLSWRHNTPISTEAEQVHRFISDHLCTFRPGKDYTAFLTTEKSCLIKLCQYSFLYLSETLCLSRPNSCHDYVS